ncbi:hypothetical protein TREMEDRAFT_24338, partial [Tremella mesenterica DSM 1558]|uniref:uncharacterized protein n=1 Tax=Tremella mesenterica (strain ATCC 24925 / CBS 8224 / DSM 1558 / NBRC 9311 / NRRL Y-6157 / RJB 2259-6 / UBC 559-6) TaxID=578456 RepID=UPI0003F49588
AYGHDIEELVLLVEYQTADRLHVHIYDAAEQQYQIPTDLFPRPPTFPIDSHLADDHVPSKLKFHHTPIGELFAFWITRGDDPEPIFDTRPANLPLHLSPMGKDGRVIRDSTISSHSLIYEDQYLQMSTSLPTNANIYGLGEVVSSSGFRRDPNGTIATMWNRDSGGTPIDENLYGSHPFYLEVRPTGSHGVFMLNSHGMDVILRPEVLQYRMIGGTFDLYFLAGPTPIQVVEQYSHVVGKPSKIPFWALAFHLSRWGWKSVKEIEGVMEKMEEKGVPLDVVWSDLDYMDRYRNFTVKQEYHSRDLLKFTRALHESKRYYVPIVDAGFGISGEGDGYDTYDHGHRKGVFIKNAEGEEFIGEVWPGKTVFPDWTNPSTTQWWQSSFDNFRQVCEYDGIWLDMNEPASFTDAPIKADPREKLKSRGRSSSRSVSPDKSVVSSSIPRPSSPCKIRTISPTKERSPSPTKGAQSSNPASPSAEKHKKSMTQRLEHSLLDLPPYAIHQALKDLGSMTVGPTCLNADGSRHYNTHNLYGYHESVLTSKVLEKQIPGKRQFILSRSTFAGSGRVAAHWLGDNDSTWRSMRESVQGVLQFQLFQIPMVGPDICGFHGDATEELCDRWMQLGAFYPFFRNHNHIDAQGQEPYRWPSVAAASRKAILARYSLLPYWESLFSNASDHGSPIIRPLFFHFPNPKLLDVDAQFMLGPSILVTPVFERGATTVRGYFPKEGAPWRCLWTQQEVKTDEHDMTTLSAPLGHINVHIRAGTILMVYDKPRQTIRTTREKSDFGLIINLDKQGQASGEVILDDGVSLNSQRTTMRFKFINGELSINSEGEYTVPNRIRRVTLLGSHDKPRDVLVLGDGQEVGRLDRS